MAPQVHPGSTSRGHGAGVGERGLRQVSDLDLQNWGGVQRRTDIRDPRLRFAVLLSIFQVYQETVDKSPDKFKAYSMVVGFTHIVK